MVFLHDRVVNALKTRIFVTSLITSLGVGTIVLFALFSYIDTLGLSNTRDLGNSDVTGNKTTGVQQKSEGNAGNTNIGNTGASTGNGNDNNSLINSIGTDMSANSSTGGAPPSVSVARTASPGVVGISVYKTDKDSIFMKEIDRKWGVGSGVIVSTGGYILTNYHVAGGTNKKILVSLSDGRSVEGRTVWDEEALDIAIVRINADNLRPVPLGDSDRLMVGETAIAIGNPFGLQFQRTVTSGIISALNRTVAVETENGINFMEDLIQTDAGINPGNSGGPLLNSRGQIIGINTVKVTTAEAIGFSIPVNAVTPVVSKFIKNGTFNEAYLGLFAYDREVVPYIDSSINISYGIFVARVDRDGPAYAGGIRPGCLITSVDGKRINTMLELRRLLYSKEPGDNITVNHYDKGKLSVIRIKLTAKNENPSILSF